MDRLYTCEVICNRVLSFETFLSLCMMYCFVSLAALSQHIEVELILYIILTDPPSAKAW